MQVWQLSISQAHPGRSIFHVLILARPCLQVLTSFLSTPRGAPTEASNAPVTITQSDNGTTSTPTPATLPSPICPAANGSTYIATNKPLPTLAPQLSLQITETSLSFEILCNTNFVDEGGPVVDLQIITNVSTLTDCLDACALFNFQTRLGHFPAYACTGIGWGEEVLMLQAGDQWPSCRLKSNVTLESPNGTATYPGYDGAVLLSV